MRRTAGQPSSTAERAVLKAEYFVKAIGYFREEPASEEDQPSAAEQNRAFLEFCRTEGLDIGATFLDRDPAGQTGFRQMVEYLRQNGVEARVVVDSLHRLGPDIRQMAHAVFQLEGLGATLICLDGTADVAQALITSWKSRGASERTGERVRAAMRRKALKGEVLGRPPYGYRVGARRRLEPVPEEASVVRYIFRLYVHEGLGVRLVARRLNEEGNRTRRGGNWSMVTIRDLLRNRAYVGTYARFGIRVPGSHPPLVSAQDFRLAQERMERRRSVGGPHTQTPFLLSGLVHCGYCGNRLIGVSRRQRWQRQGSGLEIVTREAEYRYYQCETRTNQGLCDYHTQRAAALEEAVRTCLVLELATDRSLPLGKRGDSEAELRSLNARLRLLDRRIEQLLDEGADGHLSVARVREQCAELAREQLLLDETRAVIERRLLHCEDESAQRAEREALNRSLGPGQWQCLQVSEQQRVLRRLLERVVVRDDTFELTLKST
jgi:site-specific DNA recombinase